MRSCLTLLLLLLVVRLPALAQDFSAYEKRMLIQGADTLRYRLLLPANYDAGKSYPLVLFLHGSGERGRDNEAQLKHGGTLFLRDSIRERYPAIVVFPQCPAGNTWAPVRSASDSAGKRTFSFPPDAPATRPMALLLQLIDTLERNYRIDDDRVYVGGLSMGGMGTFDLVARKPKTFAAAFPICGGGAPENAAKLRGTAWWVFHGAADPVVPWHLSEQMVKAIQQKGRSSVLFTLYPGVEHNSWDNAFAEPRLLSWLFGKTR